jgi:hypothetical protein
MQRQRSTGWRSKEHSSFLLKHALCCSSHRDHLMSSVKENKIFLGIWCMKLPNEQQYSQISSQPTVPAKSASPGQPFTAREHMCSVVCCRLHRTPVSGGRRLDLVDSRLVKSPEHYGCGFLSSAAGCGPSCVGSMHHCLVLFFLTRSGNGGLSPAVDQEAVYTSHSRLPTS